MNFKKAVNNANKILNVTKLNVSLEILNNQLLKLYSKLGLLTYNISCGIEVSQNTIDELLAEIRSNKKQIAVIKKDINTNMRKSVRR